MFAAFPEVLCNLFFFASSAFTSADYCITCINHFPWFTDLCFVFALGQISASHVAERLSVSYCRSAQITPSSTTAVLCDSYTMMQSNSTEALQRWQNYICLKRFLPMRPVLLNRNYEATSGRWLAGLPGCFGEFWDLLIVGYKSTLGHFHLMLHCLKTCHNGVPSAWWYYC